MNNNIYVTRSAMPEYEEYIEEIKTIWDNHFLTNMGPKHQQFQKELIEYLGINQIELLTNGHMAIELSLQAMGFPVGSEVITTPFTFASTTHAIVRNELVPVFCDINENDYTIDVNKIEELITEKTVAILPVHVYGNICDVEAIESIAKKHNLKVIYDAAHAFGETYKGIGIGNFGDASCFSFHATKVFNTIEGGAVCHNNDAFGKKLYQLKNFGIAGEEVVDGIGANAKMNEFCAAMGICNMRHLPEMISLRKGLVSRYLDRLSEVKGVSVPQYKENVESNYSYFPIVIDKDLFGSDRDAVCDKLKEQGIFARKYFYPITNSFECYKDSYDVESTPIAKRISERVLTLPLYPELELSDVDRICEVIIGCHD